eukprot:scaffold185796_cov63-Attheya_sp.AAC.1
MQLHHARGNTNDSIVIYSDDIRAQNGSKSYEPFKNYKTFWEHCREDDILKVERSEGRMDPVLRLYIKCCIMLPCNNKIANGEANGTQATVEKVVLKAGTQIQQVMLKNGVNVAAVKASQVSYIMLCHCNDQIVPAVFSIKPKQHTFKAKLPKPKAMQVKNDEREIIKMTAIQVPVLINNVTTGHKLQGLGVNNLFVHNWSYVQNWVYAMLSHVKTHGGLFSRTPLSTDLKNMQSLTNCKKCFKTLPQGLHHKK